MSRTHDTFVLRATMRASEGDVEVAHREWNRIVPRDHVHYFAPCHCEERSDEAISFRLDTEIAASLRSSQ